MIQEELGELYQVGEATCNLIPFTEKGLSENEANKIKWLTNLQVPSEHRKQGKAKALLQQLGKEADAAQITILIEVRPIEDNISQQDLEKLYKLHGFIGLQDEPKLMMRVPVPPMLFEQLAKKKTSNIITNLYR